MTEERLTELRGLHDPHQAIPELLDEIEQLTAVVTELGPKVEAFRDASKGNYWYWQGDGEDHLESLCVPVLIRPEKLQAIVESVERLQARLLTAAGDDLCRLTQDEIKDMTAGAVQIPPKEEFLASCERFHAQVAGEAGVMHNCLTLAQLIAENAKLTAENDGLRKEVADAHAALAKMPTEPFKVIDVRQLTLEERIRNVGGMWGNDLRELKAARAAEAQEKP